MLSFHEHSHLKYQPGVNAEWGHQVGVAMVLPNEFASVQAEFPIFFRKDTQTGQFFPVALFGFEEKENLFLSDVGWIGHYVPLVFRQGPFLIGNQPHEGSNLLAIYVDAQDKRLSTEKGELLFAADGSESIALIQLKQVLQQLHDGSKLLEIMLNQFIKYDLLERVVIEIDLNNNAKIKFDAGYTINTDKLLELKADALLEMHQSGSLAFAYNVVESIKNIQKLIDKKNVIALNL